MYGVVVPPRAQSPCMRHRDCHPDLLHRLYQRDKPRMLTLVAAMRKLLLVLNAVIQDLVP